MKLDEQPVEEMFRWFQNKIILGYGKIRRFVLHRFFMSYVDKSIARREGECLRCGACCTLMFVCPFLTREGQLFACVKHERRPMNCSLFPIDERDLRDRDIVSPDTRCGYSFRKEN